MPRPLVMLKPRLLSFDGVPMSDHNRSELSVDVERIETAKRMANGTMRKYVVADKRTFSVSWRDLPSLNAWTVDGFSGADQIETFYNSHRGAFSLAVHIDENDLEAYNVMFTDFSKTLNKRAKNFSFYNIDLTMEEV